MGNDRAIIFPLLVGITHDFWGMMDSEGRYYRDAKANGPMQGFGVGGWQRKKCWLAGIS